MSNRTFALVSAILLGFSTGAHTEEVLRADLVLAAPQNGGTNSPAVPGEWLIPYRSDHGPQKYLEWLWKDPVNLFTRPAYWRGSEWTTFAIEAGITGALMPLDRSVRDSSRDNHDKTVTSILDPIGQWYGDYKLALYGAGMFASGLLFQNEKLADSGFLAVEAVGYAAALDEGIKALTERERPRATADQYQFHGPGGRAHGSSSFVSGDAIIAFAFASSVSEVWQNPWVTWPLYILAGGVAAQRINANAHWMSDVVGAAFLGDAVGKTIVRLHYGRDAEGRLMPYMADHTVGVEMAFEF